MSEKVLCFSNELMSGFEDLNSRITDVFSKELLWLEHCFNNSTYVERSLAEGNPNWKQIIPYIITKSDNGDDLLSYTRSGSEKRLHNLVSIGVGGHINPCDFGGDMMTTLIKCASREISEELSYEGDPRNLFSFRRSDVKGLIYVDDDSGVSSDHFGVVLKVEVPYGVTMKSEGKNPLFRTLEELDTLNLEDWSRTALRFV